MNDTVNAMSYRDGLLRRSILKFPIKKIIRQENKMGK